MAKKILDDAMIKNIANYSDEIKTIENFVEAVRTTNLIGTYLGGKGDIGFINAIREVVQNAIDELIKSKSPCDRIIVSFNDMTLETIVIDNGRSLPFNRIIDICTREHTSSNYSKEPGDYSSGNHGLGLKVTNAVCQTLEVQSYNSALQKAVKVEFIEGVPTSNQPVEIPWDGKQGTVIKFIPDLKIMGNITITHKEVLGLIKKILPLTPINSPIDFSYVDVNGQYHAEQLINVEGIVSNLKVKTKEPLIAPIFISEDTGLMKADIVFTYGLDNDEEDVSSFSNLCPTRNEGSTHVIGFYEAIFRFFKEYMNKVYLAKNSKIQISNSDIKQGLKAVIAVFHLNPIFTGQSKEILSNDDMRQYVANLVYRSLDNWARSNPKDLQKLARYLKDMAEVRLSSDKVKVKLTSKYAASSTSGLPAKYVKPNGDYRKHDWELWIVEGNSAGGQGKTYRDNLSQGIFPIRGKLPNPLNTTREKYLSNEEVAGIITIIGAGYGKTCDPSKTKFKRIIAGTDADPDGSHIQTLILLLGLCYLRPLVDAGFFYKACPPLYGVRNNKGVFSYYNSRHDLVKEMNKVFSRNNTIINSVGKKISGEALSDLVYRNFDYAEELKLISDRYFIEPHLLEFILLNKDLNDDNLYKALKKIYKYIDEYKRVKDTLIIKVLVGNQIDTIFLNDKLLYESRAILDFINRINNRDIYYNLNGNNVTLYDIINTFNNSTLGSLIHYKGLGEMTGEQLAESTLHPNGNRTLIQCTASNIIEEFEAIKRLDSNKYDLIQNVTVTRQDLL